MVSIWTRQPTEISSSTKCKTVALILWMFNNFGDVFVEPVDDCRDSIGQIGSLELYAVVFYSGYTGFPPTIAEDLQFSI